MTTVQTLAAFMGIVLIILYVHGIWRPEERAVVGK
jgi:hypothetical protein